ncbi:MAG: DUF1512 domain-containing protein [Candidatus Aenigmarchaeota archaeon]|nr:DUF1512 domain-containing protein [Candidatus Aenigmarchaeota archaeon]
MYTYFQFTGGGDFVSWIAWFVLMAVFFMFYPRMMIGQIMWKIEKSAVAIEKMAKESKKIVVSKITNKPNKELKEKVDRFYEFFSTGPVDLDPNGIIKKWDYVVREQKDRFTRFVNDAAPKLDKENKANVEMGFAAGITLYDVAKIVRHFVELAKKTKNLQIAMIIQMQLPMIERISKSLYVGTKALSAGQPIGDALGPLVAADLIGNVTVKEIEEDIVVAKTKIKGRQVFVMKSKGPGGRLGYPGRAVQKLISKNKIVKIITIDAAAKLEGEKTGSVAEGIGVAMGGIGVERSYIEDVAVKKGIPIDSVIVKMSQEEAIMPMRKAIKDAVPKVKESIDRFISSANKTGSIIIVGVGNTSGVGNSKKSTEETIKWVNNHEKELLAKQKGKKSDAEFLDI